MSRCKFYEKVTVDNIPQLDFLYTEINEFLPKSPVGYFVVTESDVGRIDKISYSIYHNSAYWWIICLQNNIINPFSELSVGQVLEIPAIEDIYEFYRNRKLR